MDSNLLLALLGAIIVAGFFANLIFKYTKIPTVIQLMLIGLVLSPILGEDKQQLFELAPTFGTIALLIILFAGGIKLNIRTVVSQLGKAVFLAFLAFLTTMAITVPTCVYLIGLPLLQSFILATLVSGTASSIVIPVVTKLSVRDEVSTFISIESALSNLLILVVVIIVADIHIAEDANVFLIIWSFLKKILISLVAAVFAGVLWARLMGAMRNNSLSYMLTLGFIFLLNYLVDKAGGNGAISILFFGIVLANVSRIADQFGARLTKFLGIQVDSASYALNEFLKGISEELSFLVATFFFTYLGLLVSFDELSMDMWINIIALILLIVIGRMIALPIFFKINKQYSFAEKIIVLAMLPRGLATAVMAFIPGDDPYNIAETENFPLYAMVAILGSNLIMTGFVAWGEALLAKEKRSGKITEAKKEEEVPETGPDEKIKVTRDTYDIEKLRPDETEAETKKEEPDLTTADEPEPIESLEHLTFTERVRHWFRIDTAALVHLDKRSVRSIRMGDVVFWVKLMVSFAFTTLGVLKNDPLIVFGAMFFSPLVPVVNTTGLGIVTGDLYISLRAISKIVISLLIAMLFSTFIISLIPFTTIPEEVTKRITPTILDFGIAIVAGFILPIVLLRNRRIEAFAITPIISLLIIPPLTTVAYGLGTGWGKAFMGEVLLGGALSFASNITAMLIGAVLSLIALGMTKHPASEFIQEWKKREIEEGTFHDLIEKLHLTKVLKYVGSFRARLIILLVLAIALFVPLQITFNNIVHKYQVEQTISSLMNEYFESADQSSFIISYKIEEKENSVLVLARLATEESVSEDRQEEFENKAEEKLGIPVNLELMETMLENGGEQIDDVFAFDEDAFDDAGQFSDKLSSVNEDLDEMMRGMEELPGFSYTGFQTRYVPGRKQPIFIAEYFSVKEPDLTTLVLLRNQLAARLNLPDSLIRLSRVPMEYGAKAPQLEAFRDASGNYRFIDILPYSAPAKVLMEVPAGIKDDSVTALEAQWRGTVGDSLTWQRFSVQKGTEGGFKAYFSDSLK